jgi:hypothetical protein
MAQRPLALQICKDAPATSYPKANGIRRIMPNRPIDHRHAAIRMADPQTAMSNQCHDLLLQARKAAQRRDNVNACAEPLSAILQPCDFVKR